MTAYSTSCTQLEFAPHTLRLWGSEIHEPFMCARKNNRDTGKRIIYKSFELIEFRTNENPILILEKAIRNISPRVQLKAKRIGGATYQVPTLLNKYRATNIAIRWVVEFSRKRSGKGMSLKLANELLEASKGMGNSVKRKEETHKMAEANKAFAQVR